MYPTKSGTAGLGLQLARLPGVPAQSSLWSANRRIVIGVTLGFALTTATPTNGSDWCGVLVPGHPKSVSGRYVAPLFHSGAKYAVASACTFVGLSVEVQWAWEVVGFE
jgi:hypothetical protein